MYSVGLDVDNEFLVSTVKILLYSENSDINYFSPPILVMLGTILNNSRYLNNILIGQSAGNFRNFSSTSVRNASTKFNDLPKISHHVPKKTNLDNDKDFGYFLAGLIEGDGWFGYKNLHLIFHESDISLAYLIKKKIGYGNVYKIKDKKAVRYICRHSTGLLKILNLINGKLVSNFKYDQLIKHNYSKLFNIDLLPPVKKVTLDNF
jgi:hypothetical protein